MTAKTDSLLRLIRDAGTLDVMREFLKKRNIPSTAGSWDLMISDRIEPALEAGQLTEKVLLELLRDLEEHGRQHTFVYRPKSGIRLPDDSALRRWLGDIGSPDLVGNPRLAEKPAKPVISDVRREDGVLVIKVVETREFRDRLKEEVRGNQVVVTYNVEMVRAVNIVRFHANGLLVSRFVNDVNVARLS